MRQLTLFPSRGDAYADDREQDDEGAERGRLFSLRTASASRSPRTTSESDYVSFADLTDAPPRSVAARAARLVGLSSRRDDNDTAGDGDDGLVPITHAGARGVRRLQDALLVSVAGLCVVLVCWAYAQLYAGTLCATTTTERSSPPRRSNATAPNSTGNQCAVLPASSRFASKGAPDVALRGHAFAGGWPLPHSLLHVFVPVVVLLCVVAMRIHSSTVHSSLAWLWLGLMELSVLTIDTIALRRWRGPICRQLQAAIVSSLTPQTTARWTGQCETRAYEAFMGVEMLLVVALVLLVLLEPVVFRLWCGVGQYDDTSILVEGSDVKGAMETLQREDALSPHAAYGRL